MIHPQYLLSQTWPLQLALIFSVLVARAFIVAGGSSLWVRLSKWASSRMIMPGRLDRGKLIREILSGLRVLLMDTTVAVFLIKTGVFHFLIDEGLGAKLATFAAMFVWVEIYFYYSHRLMHRKRLFFIHRQHHASARLNPWTSLSFSVVERLVLLFGATLIPALVSCLLPISFRGYVGYFFFNYVLNVYGHLNVETLPPSFARSLAGWVFNTTTYHTLHHMRYNGHYGLFTPFLDRWHGTRFPDFEAIHARNYQGTRSDQSFEKTSAARSISLTSL